MQALDDMYDLTRTQAPFVCLLAINTVLSYGCFSYSKKQISKRIKFFDVKRRVAAMAVYFYSLFSKFKSTPICSLEGPTRFIPFLVNAPIIASRVFMLAWAVPSLKRSSLIIDFSEIFAASARFFCVHPKRALAAFICVGVIGYCIGLICLLI
jgi:hypothetical protein